MRNRLLTNSLRIPSPPILGVALAAVLLGNPPSSVLGQTVQLPSFRSFSYSGTVEVPDGGSAYLGGNSAGIISQSSRSNSTAVIGGVSGLYTKASIIDLNEMDRQILGFDPTLKGRSSSTSRSNGEKTKEEIRQGKRWVRIAREDLENGRVKAAAGAYRNSLRYLDTRLADLARLEYRRNIPAAYRSGAL